MCPISPACHLSLIASSCVRAHPTVELLLSSQMRVIWNTEDSSSLPMLTDCFVGYGLVRVSHYYFIFFPSTIYPCGPCLFITLIYQTKSNCWDYCKLYAGLCWTLTFILKDYNKKVSQVILQLFYLLNREQLFGLWQTIRWWHLHCKGCYLSNSLPIWMSGT
jgi:hypothetical protein